MYKNIGCLLYLFVASILFGTIFAEPNASQNSVEYIVSVCEKEPVCLCIIINNTGNNDLEIREFSLPWANAGKMLMVGLNLESYEELAETLPISDPSDLKKVVLKAGASIEGSIKLSKRFPDINDHLKDSDVLIFWSDVLPYVSEGRSNRQGGWIVIPKRDRGQASH